MSKREELYRKLQLAELKTAVKRAELAAAMKAEDHAYKRYKDEAAK